MQVYLVGGAVRDKLLGLDTHEHDWVVVGSTPEHMLNLGYRQVGKEFPVFLHPKTHEEYALARTEKSTGPGYAGFHFDFNSKVSLEDDLKRRDLTINAIAEDADGNLIDPYNGVKDLREGKLRAVSPAFAEDPVRVLRAAKFAARFHLQGFHITHDTHELMQKMVKAGELDHLIPERVWQETAGALATASPERYFEVLRACGALKIVFPEIDRLFGVPQPLKYHPEKDVGVHTMLALKQAAKLSPKPTIRFAALLHDLGKGTTAKELLPSHHGHEGRSAKLVLNLCDRLKVPNEFKKLAHLVAKYHGHFLRVADELSAKKILEVLKAVDAFRKPARFYDFLMACEADLRGRPGFENNKFPQAEFFQKALSQAQSIQVKDIIARGFEGIEIKQELERLQTEAISELTAHRS